MIQFDEKADLGHCQMVDEVNLSYHTQNGWRLLAVVQDTFSTPMPLTIPAYNDHNGTWHPERTTTEYVPATSTRFLLTKTSDQTLQDLSRQLQSQEREILELRSALEKAKPLQTQLDQVTKAREEGNQTIREMAVREGKLRDTLKELQSQFQMLSDREKSIERLQKLEDWVLKLSGMITQSGEESIASWKATLQVIGEPDLTSRKSWAERLQLDDLL